jgi:integrase
MAKATSTRGQIIARPRKDGSTAWLVRVYRGQDEDGRRSYRSETIVGTRRNASKRLTELLAEKDSFGQLSRLTRQTVSAYLSDWLDNWLDGVSEKTRASYRWLMESYVMPDIGLRKVAALSDEELQRLFRRLSAGGKSPRTVRYTATVFKSALRHGVQRGVLTRNAMENVTLPKLARRRHELFTPELAKAFLAAAENDRWAALWAVCLASGIRPGEALALRWSDLRGNTISIQRSRGYVAKHGWLEHEPKTAKARRSIALPEFAVSALREHRRRQAEQRLQVGPEYKDQGYVFAGRFGEPIGLRSLDTSHLKKLLSDAGLPSLRLYDLRHFAATLRLANGEHPKIVSEMLGHSSVTLTLDTYSHVTQSMQQQSAARLDNLLFPDSKAQSR